MKIVRDVFNNSIEITKERWKHVCEQHPEMKSYFDNMIITLDDPDVIRISKSDGTVRLYYRFFESLLKGKYILVVVKSNKRNFLVTAYVTDYIKIGEEIWKRKS